jgi:hydroxyacid-oxoacid transhydrogenase
MSDPGPAGGVELPTETVVNWQAPPLKFGLGATDEIGEQLLEIGLGKVLLVSDRHLQEMGLPARVARTIEAAGVEVEVFAGSQVEPTDRSIRRALAELEGEEFDGYVGVGGGSSLDTAKAINLLKTYPADLMTYINRPVGEGAPIPGALKPLVAVPTTAGTGSESTPVCVVDLLDLKVKAGVSGNQLRPWLAVVDPLNTMGMSPEVTAAGGYDVMTHALESYTARAYDRRPRYPDRLHRPAYIGANPISDVWCERALELVGRFLRRAVLNGDDLEARVGMAMAATFAGMGFGNAGVHVPHAVAYPIAGMVREYVPAGYPGVGEPLVPHGQSVIVTAPATFEFTYATAPERHLRAAQLLGASLAGVTEANGRELLPETIRQIVQDTGGPAGISAFGYQESDVAGLVEGTLKQERLLSGCPREVGQRELERVVRGSLRY